MDWLEFESKRRGITVEELQAKLSAASKAQDKSRAAKTREANRRKSGYYEGKRVQK